MSPIIVEASTARLASSVSEDGAASSARAVPDKRHARFWSMSKPVAVEGSPAAIRLPPITPPRRNGSRGDRCSVSARWDERMHSTTSTAWPTQTTRRRLTTPARPVGTAALAEHPRAQPSSGGDMQGTVRLTLPAAKADADADREFPALQRAGGGLRWARFDTQANEPAERDGPEERVEVLGREDKVV